MRIIIGGAGEVGFRLARVLRAEGNDVIIIEEDPDMVKRAKTLDVLLIEGNAASPETLDRAQIATADLYIAVTPSDEVNLLSSAFAATRLTKTIVRVNEFEFMTPEAKDALERLGIMNVFCSSLLSAQTLVNLIEAPSVIDARPVAGGNAFIVTMRATQRSTAAGKSLDSIKFPPEAKVLAIYEERDLIIPREDYMLVSGQRAIIMLDDIDVLPELERLFGQRSLSRVGKVVITGANDMALFIARQLEDRKDVLLMTDSPEMAEEASRLLDSAHPVLIDPMDSREMDEVGIGSADVFVAAGEDEERNIISCFQAKRLGATRTMAIIRNHDLGKMALDMGIDIVVNPRWTTISAILEYVHEVEYEAIHLIEEDAAQLLELEVASSSDVVGRPVRSVNVAGEVVIGAILRDGLGTDGTSVRKVKIARDNDLLMAGDHLIVLALREAIPRLRRVLK
ncbi:MAG: Trk system potassium transporter TrkA [Thermoplasmata archaeon]|nr:Trk system potassium transporter TrkA [Thermoplasmata archaeon]